MPILMLCIIFIRSIYIYVRTYMYIYIYKNIHLKKHTLRIHFFWMWVFGFIRQRQLPIFTARLSRGGKKNTEFTDLTSFPLPPLDVRIVFPSSTFTPTRRPRYPVPAGGHFWSVTSWWFYLGVFFGCWPTKQAIRNEKRRTWVILGLGGCWLRCVAPSFSRKKNHLEWVGIFSFLPQLGSSSVVS